MRDPTTRLYYADPLLTDFEATVLAYTTWEARPAVALDRSAFYPESGGQLGDHGALGGAAVLDVQLDGDVVLHVVDDPALAGAPGATVRGRVDRARRRLQTALHTGQHMLSRALLDVAGAATVSSRLGERASTIDVDLAKLDERDVAKAEALVNAVVEDDAVVRAYFPDAGELAALPLRRAPKVTDNVRVVDIAGFDVSPCGGTHCTRTAQVGVVTVTGVERYKGKVRVTFLAGRAAVGELAARSRALADLGRDFTCGPLDVRAGVERLRRDLQDARTSLGEVRGRWTAALAAELLAAPSRAGDPRVVHALDGEPVETLRALATHLTARPDVVALLATRLPDGVGVLVARGAASAFDCGAWLKRAAAAHGGRGGGRPDRAEGRLPPGADWDAIAREE